MKISESLITCKDRVENILRLSLITRDSDKLLWLAYMATYHNLKNALGAEAYETLKNILMNDNTPTMETVRRIRQKFQQDGLYVGENRQERLSDAEDVRHLMR